MMEHDILDLMLVLEVQKKWYNLLKKNLKLGNVEILNPIKEHVLIIIFIDAVPHVLAISQKKSIASKLMKL